MGGITEINATVSPSGGWIDQLTMADVQPTKRGGKICAAIGCHNTTYNSEVSLFRFPNEKDKDR